MKKHILKVLLLCCAMLLLNCQNDDRQFEEEATQLPIFKEIGFEELQRFPKAVEKIQNLGLRGDNLHSRTVYDSVNNFTIHTDKILLVEFNDYHWITFPISRDYPTDATENIILRYNTELHLYDVFLAEYQFTPTEKENIVMGIYPNDILQRTNLMLLENFDASLLNRSRSTSDPIRVDANGDCYSIDRIFEVDGKVYFTTIDVPCPPGIGNNQGGSTQQHGNNQGIPSYIPPTSTDPTAGTNSGSHVVVYPGGTGANYVYTPPVRVPADQLLPTKPLVLTPFGIEYFYTNLDYEQKLWWNHSGNYDERQVIIDYLNGNPTKVVFAEWAVDYLRANPTVTITQFENRFMGTSEGQDGNYDSAYWNNPNLTFPRQNLPTWNNFKAAFPLDSDPLYDTPLKMLNSIGGQVASFYNGPNTNTCAFRLSKALNYSGVVIPNIPGQTFKGSDNKYYFKAAYQINLWMRKTFGTGQANKHYSITGAEAGEHGVELPSLLSEIKGIYSLYSSDFSWASGHADLLYPDATCGNNCHFYDAPIHRIDVWELN